MLISAANIPPSYRQSSTSWGAELDPGTESVYILGGQAVPRGRPMRGWARLLAFLQENPAMREDVDLCTPGLCRGWRRNEGGQMVATLVVSSWKHDTEDGDPHPTLSSFVLSPLTALLEGLDEQVSGPYYHTFIRLPLPIPTTVSFGCSPWDHCCQFWKPLMTKMD